MSIRNRQWLLAQRPSGAVSEANFRLVEKEMPALQDGEVLVKVHYLSLDPYMRGRMEETKSYAAPQPLNQVMIGGTVGEVIESKNAKFQPGEMVVGFGGWQEYHVSDGSDLRKVDTRQIPASVYLGTVGMPGVTAWYGLNRIGKPKPGETVVVSAASGAVGSVVGQLAKVYGCRAVGIAGGKAKCDYVVNELGFDACVDYKSADFAEAFKAATAKGIDIVFENVGGAVFDAALARMNAFGRVALCGLIAGYNGEDIALRNVRSILVNRLTIEGFIVAEHMDLWPRALTELAGPVAQGKLKYRESIAQGIESVPQAFMGMLKGANFGKQLVKMV
jgi:NADPH-dependent curcumin reductase CurA